MTVEELLKPRYKVIAEDTSGNFKVGDIFYWRSSGESGWGGNDGYYSLSNKAPKDVDKLFVPTYVDQYPHLFRLMHWSEERKPEDMPKYVKYIATGAISKLTTEMIDYGVIVMEDYLPATLSEYTEYINSKR